MYSKKNQLIINFIYIQQPIPKPKGNYVNMPKTLKISKIKHNDYQVGFVFSNLINRIILILYLLYLCKFRIIYVIWLSFMSISIKNIKNKTQKQ